MQTTEEIIRICNEWEAKFATQGLINNSHNVDLMIGFIQQYCGGLFTVSNLQASVIFLGDASKGGKLQFYHPAPRPSQQTAPTSLTPPTPRRPQGTFADRLSNVGVAAETGRVNHAKPSDSKPGMFETGMRTGARLLKEILSPRPDAPKAELVRLPLNSTEADLKNATREQVVDWIKRKKRAGAGTIKANA